MYRSKKPVNWVAFRIALVAALFAAGTVLLTVRAYRLQVSDADTLKKRADKQRTRVIHLESRRGAILDRSGEQLAVSLEVNSIYAKPRKVVDKKDTARTLAEILEMDEKEILKKLDEDKTFVWIQRRVSPLVAEKVKKSELQGVIIGTEYQRFYPLKSLAAHAVGFAGLDSSGLEGLELLYDQDLKVDPIPVTAQRDALGRPVMFTAIGQDPKRRDLHLTLDRNIQYVAERELEEAIHRSRAKDGVVVVLNLDSGEILAMAVRPTYNLNVFHKASAEARRNRSVSDTFEPGSTFKVFLAAAALDLARIGPNEMFDCQNGLYKYNGAEIHDVVPHKMLSFDEVIIDSSNIGAVKISEKLKKSEFYRVLSGFGFGSATGVDLPGERPGLLPPPGKWSVLTKGNIAFGQGISVNAVQLTAAFAAAVNGGILYKPRLMNSITNALGETIRVNQPAEIRRVIKESTSEKIVEILRSVVARGTGKSAAIPGVDVIGKTGTAQKPDPAGGYSQDRYVASFIGALMSIKPRLAIFVLIDEPAGKIRTGGKTAAPVFRKIGEGILALCGSKPVEQDLIMASACPASKKTGVAAHRNITVRRGPRQGEWIVPDLKGLDMRQVMEVCGKIKCDATFQGMGHAVGQEPKPGNVLKEGAPLTVSFEGQSS
ncbi:MAG TPA: penicillin-binding protein [Desulfomonilaceae bacterium]|nr:penicillin-binding protein [Desulfomonilaceae bacterium]